MPMPQKKLRRGAKTSMSVYEPFYRALMGMGVAAWAPGATVKPAHAIE